ncbi:hypothetical protein ACIQNI_24835 [Streptomyces sp. NPDC091266]|uniref:hypothetical protein n=1 Tax=Streptomyces sp. NPDC091266 TaxID=3365978 RepID=UPI00382FAFEC
MTRRAGSRARPSTRQRPWRALRRRPDAKKTAKLDGTTKSATPEQATEDGPDWDGTI